MVIALGLALWVSPAMANPVDVYSENGPQDPLFVEGPMDELGDWFPPDELIESWWEPWDQPACWDGNDDPAIPNVLVTMTNLTDRTFPEVYYVADPETSITNFDGWIGNAGLGDAQYAFKIDWIGINRPLISESMTVDNIFQPGERWAFIIQDYQNALGGPPAPFDSLGIASMSMGWPPSTGSIIATPVPAAVLLLGSGFIGLVAVRRRFETKPNPS